MVGQCERCDERTVLLSSEEQRTVLMGARSGPAVVDGEVEDDQRTVLITGRPKRPAPAEEDTTVVVADDDQRTIVVRAAQLRPAAPGRGAPAPSPQHWGQPGNVPLAEGFPEELTTSLTGSLLGAKAAPPRPVPKTSYRMVIPALILGLALAIGVGILITMVASGAIEDFFDSVIRPS